MSILLGILAASSPLSAVAVTVDDRRTVAVSAHDLDLSKPADVKRFNRRVGTAVGQVCAVSGRSLDEMAWRDACVAQAKDGARSRVEQMIANAATGPAQSQVALR